MGVLRASNVDKDGNLFKRYPMEVALKRGFSAQTYIVGKFNQKAKEPLMTKAYIEHLIKKKEIKFPICCIIDYSVGNQGYGYPYNVCLVILDKYIEKTYGKIQTSITGKKVYPESFVSYIKENYPVTEWTKQIYGSEF